MKKGAGRFILGIEGLTALVTGASALVAFVSALVLWIVITDARSTIEASSLARAESIYSALGSRPSQSKLESLVSSTVPGGGVRSVAVASGDEITASYPPVSREEIFRENTVCYTGSRGYTIYLLMELSPVLVQGGPVVFLLVIMGLFLTAVAILVPSYLRRRVLEPLRSILGQADRVEKGSGRSAETAGASFRKLVDLLARKDRELDTMRREALARAETAESRSGAVLEAMGSAVIVLNRNNLPTMWNARACEIFGPIQKGAGSSLLTDVLSPFTQRGIEEWDGDSGGRTYRYRVTTSQTGEKVVLATDVTASLALERKLTEESALADLGALSAGVAHEIGNALCALEGFMQLLGRGSDSARTREILQEAEYELASAGKIVDSFRNLAQQNSIESTMSCREAADSIRGLCETCSVVFRTDSEMDENVSIPGSAVIIGRILGNLVNNALRYSSPDSITVTAECRGEETFIFSVKDDGPGLPPDPEVVFRPMYTTEGDKGGMGLGLTITRRLVRAMGGTVKACTGNEGGAVFTVAIPVSREDT